MATPASIPERRTRNLNVSSSSTKDRAPEKEAAYPGNVPPGQVRSPGEEAAYPGDALMEAVVSRGIKHNGPRCFHLEILGSDYYRFRAMIEACAMHAAKEGSFINTLEAVRLWEKLNKQAKGQGF